MIKLYNMDVIEALKQMPDESVDMQITSPPYWGLRDYGVEGQIGLEPNFEDYIKKLCDIFDEVKRVLKKDGTCWVNLGDTYSSGNRGNNAPDKLGEGRDGLNSPNRNDCGVIDKCLICVPERFCIEMINRGWILRNKIIWHKPNHMPTSVKDRFANSWEYLFMFSKSQKYYFDLDAVREPHKEDSFKRALRGTSGKDKSSLNPMHGYKRKFSPHGILDERALNPKGKNPGDIIVSQKEQEYFEQSPIKGGGNKNQPDLMRHLRHPLGKNPDDIIQTPYAVAERDKEFVDYRNLPDIKEFSKYINDKRKKQRITIEEIETRLESQSPHHWFNAESFPSVEDYKWLKEVLSFGEKYDKQMTEVFTKPAEKQNNPSGKNPDDVISAKFQIGDDYRQGMNRDETGMIEVRPNLPTQEEITEFLIEWTNGFEDALDKEFGEHKWRHWIRKDDSGFSYPSRKDWITMKTMLKFPNTYDEQMLDFILKPNMVLPNELGKNPSDFWDITTKGYPEAHFAVFPEALVERPIKTTRKNAVILDIFAGSGTTLKVARRLHRDSIGIEIKSEYCELIKKRLFKGNVSLFPNEMCVIKGGNEE